MEPLGLLELSPRGAGAISVLQLSGSGALERARELCRRELEPGDLRLVRLAHEGDDLDEALVWVHDATRVELHVHGSPPLVERLFAVLGLARSLPAARTLEQRALELLACAPGEDGARILLDQAEGALRQRLERWEELDDVALALELSSLAEESRLARFALEPARVVLAGPVNAGKSTLFNVLVGSRRVITSAHEGTTRDLVTQRAHLAGWPVELVDTAGERELADAHAQRSIELEGQRLARRAREAADLVLRLRPPGDTSSEAVPDGVPVVELATQGDREEAAPGALSAVEDPGASAALVAARFRQALGLPERAWSSGRGVLFEAQARGWLAGLGSLGPAECRAAAVRFCAGSGE